MISIQSSFLASFSFFLSFSLRSSFNTFLSSFSFLYLPIYPSFKLLFSSFFSFLLLFSFSFPSTASPIPSSTSLKSSSDSSVVNFQPDSSSITTPSLSNSPSDIALPQPTSNPKLNRSDIYSAGFEEIGIVINNNQTHYTAHFRGTIDETCSYLSRMIIPITVFWRYHDYDASIRDKGPVSEIILVDPFTGLELTDALQITYTPYYESQKVFDSNTRINPRSDFDTWNWGNGPDRINSRSLFEDTFSATKILSLKSWDNLAPYCAKWATSPGISGIIAADTHWGPLPSIEFSFCPVLRTQKVQYGVFHNCLRGGDYSTATFSFVPDIIPDPE